MDKAIYNLLFVSIIPRVLFLVIGFALGYGKILARYYALLVMVTIVTFLFWLSHDYRVILA